MPYIIPSYTVSPGAVYQPRGQYILDRIPGAVAAWSTRRLISTAPASIARGRDATTNEEDFTQEDLAGDGFTDLANGGDGFYPKLYDQIGSNDAAQTTAGAQPKGVTSGSLLTQGIYPALEFGETGKFLKNTSQDLNIKGDLTFVLSFRWAATSLDTKTLLAFSGNGETADSNFIYNLAIPSGTGEFRYAHEYEEDFEVIDSGYAVLPSTNYNIIVVRDSTSKSINFYVDGVPVGNGTYTNDPTGGASSNLNIGGREDLGTRSFNGKIWNAIIFNRALSAVECAQLNAAL